MTGTALLLDVVFVLVAFGGRTLVQWRRTGDPGWRLGRPHGTAELVARVLLVGAALLLVVALIPDTPAPGAAVAVIGVALALAGALLVVVAQLQMGASWRIGVDPDERTALVRTGLYASVRNPIYSGMAVFALGQVLLLPNGWGVTALAAVVVGIEIQVRGVEEPFLRAAHGPGFTRWAARTGRFAPGVGRLR